MGTGQIIAEGIETFAPATNRLYEIAMEFIKYFVYITGGRLGIMMIRGAVKRIINYLNKKSVESISVEGRRTTYHGDQRLFNKEDVDKIEDYHYAYTRTKPRSNDREGLVHEHNVLYNHTEPGERTGVAGIIDHDEMYIDYNNRVVKSKNPYNDDERDMDDPEEMKYFKSKLQEEYKLYYDHRRDD